MKKKKFARELKSKYENNIQTLINDFSYFREVRTGTLSHCSLFAFETIGFVLLLGVIISLIISLTNNYSVAGWTFIVAIALVATIFRTKWEITNRGLRLVSPILRRSRYFDICESCDLEVNSSTFKLSVKLSSGIKFVLKDGSLGNIYSIYDFFQINCRS